MKALLRALTALALLALLVPFPGISAQGDPAAVVQRYQDALNRGDVAGVMATFADDAVREGIGLCRLRPCVGKEAIQKDVERQVAENLRTTVLSTEVSSNTVTIRAEARSDPIRAAGFERTITISTFEVRGDKIAAQRTRTDTSDPQSAAYGNYVRLTALLRQHFEIRNRGDVAAALESFTDDAVFEAAGCRPACVGKEAIRQDLERGVSVNRQQTISNLQVSGNTVTFRIETRTDTVRAAGVERIVASATAEFRDGKIAALRSVQDTSDPQTAQFVAWQQAQRTPAQLPRTGELPVPLATALGVGALVLGIGFALRRSPRAG